MRRQLHIPMLLTLFLGLGCAGGPPDLEIYAPTPPQADKYKIVDSKDKEKCHGGCTLKKHDIPEFTEADYHNTIEDYAAADPTTASPALEKLLFYRIDTLERLDTLGTGSLSSEHLAFLRRELSRSHAIVSMRLVDVSDGITRVELEPTRVPLGKKEHLHPQRLGGIQPFEMNGTPLRVGLGHIWARY